MRRNAMEQTRILPTVCQPQHCIDHPNVKPVDSETNSCTLPFCESHERARKGRSHPESNGKRLFCSDQGTPFVFLLSSCAKRKDLLQGILVHDEIAGKGLLRLFSDGLVTMFAKCGDACKARQLLEMHDCKNLISWTALIAEYVRQGDGKEALNCFELMQSRGLSPDAVTCACVLKACATLKATQKGERVHNEIARNGLLAGDNVLGNALIDMYAKCDNLPKAQQVLEGLPSRNVVSWNSLISGYVNHNQGEQALLCFNRLQHDGISPDVVTYTCILKACSCMKAIDKGSQIHNEVDRQGLLAKSLMLGTALIDMYAKCGALEKAKCVLLGLPSRNIVPWNALLTGYAQHGQGDQAITCFDEMQQEGHDPDAVTYNCMLQACSIVGSLEKGEEIHEHIVKQGLLRNNLMLGNSLVDMYAKCGALVKAKHVLDDLPCRDAVSWNALIGGCLQQGQGEEALNCFDQMQREGISSDTLTLASALKACGIVGAIQRGEQIHDDVDKQGLLGTSSMLGNALVDMYVKCRALDKAQQVLEKLPFRDIVSWSALISGFAQAGQGEEALNCFQVMQCEGLSPDEVTLACLLKACGSIGAIDKGKQIHDEIAEQSLLAKNVILGNALVDMYVKCGALPKALEVLEELPARNVVSWSAIIGGYAQQGQYGRTLTLFKRMQDEGIQPDGVTISCVLSACRHGGLEEEEYGYFSNMSTKYGINLDVEHYTLIVDLLGCAGHLDQAARVIQEMPSHQYYVVWAALLGACQKWGDVKVGRWAFENAIHVDNTATAAYVLMANIYAAAGMHKDAENIEAMRITNNAFKSYSTV